VVQQRAWSRDHSARCWEEHPECAVRAAAALLDSRIEHTRGQLARVRGGFGRDGPDFELLEFCRQLLREAASVKWARLERGK
jgi:hypothetical protein